MCLAIPGKIIEITVNLEDVFKAGKVSFGGIVKEVNLSMVPDARVGEYVLVHVGTAISTIDEEEARKVFEYIQKTGDIKEELELE
jgi:hydrogenase expression/formation protein HypC